MQVPEEANGEAAEVYKAIEITFGSNVLQDPHEALRREWLVTNGLGGYASATLATANTRRYHGLLVAALDPPVGRAVLLSKLEETLHITDGEGKTTDHALSANVYPGALYPRGYETLAAWSAYPAPMWRWNPAPGVIIEKRVWMAHGQNTTYISYRLLALPDGQAARLSLVPLLAWRSYHSEMAACDFEPEADWTDATLHLTLPAIDTVTKTPTRLLLHVLSENASEHGETVPAADFASSPNWYYHFQHPREQERGQDYQEDLYTPGTLTAPCLVGQSLTIVASVEPLPLDPKTAWSRLIQHQEAILQETILSDKGDRVGLLPAAPSFSVAPAINNVVTSAADTIVPVADEGTASSASTSSVSNVSLRPDSVSEIGETFTQQLTLAADQFLVQVPNVRVSVIAGYPWFCDWGRDTMIALPGLCLATGRAEIARDILLSFAAHVDQGMLPNRFPDAGTPPEYNTVDATLWYFVAIYRYVVATDDTALLSKGLWSVLKAILDQHWRGTRYNIHVDAGDSLLYAGQPGVQLTWMDAKVGEWVVTPRIGKPVEINALWINALAIMAHFARLLNDPGQDTYTQQAQQAQQSFVRRFARADGQGLYDVLDTPWGEADASIRPNQIFALSLPFPVVEANTPLAAAILATVRDQLLTPCGLRTLSPQAPAFQPRYEGDSHHRDGAYHQGTVWPWLLGPYTEAYVKVTGDKEGAKTLLLGLQSQLTTFGIGSLAEVFDGMEPQRPNGCFAQAWSIAETLRVWQWLSTCFVP